MKFEQWRHYYRARLFQMLKRPARAIEEYRAALHHNPGFAKAAACIGYLEASEAHYADAERYFGEALRLDPGNADMHFNLGYVYDRQHKHEQAITQFQQALALDAKIDRAWYGMGMAHAALGRHDEAARALAQASTLQPMNPHAWYAYGMAEHHRNNPDKVKEIALHLHRFDPVMCRRLIQDAQRNDLAHLVKDLAV